MACFYAFMYFIVTAKSTSKTRVGSILDFSFDIDSGQKTSNSISIFSISVESVKFQWMSEKKHLAVGWAKI